MLTQYQKQGVGTALLKLIRQQALDSSKLILNLDVDCDNDHALNFDLGQGFVALNKSEVSPRMQALGIGSHLHMNRTL